MEEGGILPSFAAGEPMSPAVTAVVRAVQGWEGPQEGRQGSQQLTRVYFCNSPSSMGKIPEVAELKRFPPEALCCCASPLRSSTRGHRRLFPSPRHSSAVLGRGWAGPGTPELWGKSQEPGSGLAVLEPVVPGTNDLGLSFGKGGLGQV